MQNLFQVTVLTFLVLAQTAVGLVGREQYGVRLLEMVSCNYDIHDGSQGVVELPKMDRLLNKYGIKDNVIKKYHTFTSFNHVNNITYLLEEALDNDNDGDAIYLYHKYLYAGSNETTKLDVYSPLVQDILEIVDDLVAEGKKGLQKLDRLKFSTAVPVISRLYEKENVQHVEKANKRSITSTLCDVRYTAPSARCRSLVDAISPDWSTKAEGLRHLEYNGCFLSWSKNSAFTMEDLAPSNDKCFTYCHNPYFSCRVKSVLSRNNRVTRCLSGRAIDC